ncbi:hypothetical protein EV121DRAFT_253243 [Schizophyllum commune]
MLAHDQTKSARPRPPAQRRRQSTGPATVKKGGASPPPPYSGAGFSFPASSPSPPPRRRLESLLGSPMSATLKALGWDLDADPTNSSGPNPDWLTEESRDELADLLVKADGLIKERQNELGLTVNTLKSLYDNNAALKTQHRALLSRIPASPIPSPGPESRPGSPAWFADKLPRAMSDVFARGPMRHTRKISVSQSDLSYLSEQNAELLDKLSKLEAESSQADQKGRRMLQRLEGEIAQLREELDKAQARSVELEEQTRASPPRETVEERKERIMTARKMSSAQHDPEPVEEEVKDFAPGGALCSTTSYTTPKKSRRDEEEEDFPEEHVRSPSTQSLISQLLAKIQELEDTNQRIVEQQHDTNSRLQSVQRETENISRLYECLNDPNNVQLELIEEGGVEQPAAQKATSAKDTIRFQSFRRTLEQDVAKHLSAESTAPSHFTKTRKSVMGLFDSPSTSQAASRSQNDSSSLRLPPIPFRAHTTSFSADTSFSLNRPASPALSALSLASHTGHAAHPSFSQVFSQLPTPSHEQHPTLQAELGGEALDGQWGLHGESHLRRSSLYSFSSISVPPSPSPMPASSSLAFPPITRSRSPSPSPTRAAPQTPIRQPMFSLEPPTPETPMTANGDRLETPQAQRYRRMSQTVRARTTRWVEGRFRESLLGDSTPGRKDLAEALEAMAEGSITPGPMSPIALPNSVPEEEDEQTPRHAQTTAVERSPQKGVASAKQKGVVKLVVEAWLWLQFLLIILVFVWAMAKRGPKAVLREAERKRRAGA